MSRSKGLVCLSLMVVVFSIGYAAAQDRVAGDLVAGGKVALKGNVHGLAKAQFDLGHADRSRMLEGVSLSFHPSVAQQKDLDQFIADLGNPASPHYHKYLTTAQFADRFGMSRSDIARIVGWLQSEGFTNIAADNSRNRISFDGTVAQVESVFALEMHNYLINGEVHLANANNPSVPSALKDAVIGMGHLNDFAPKPHIKARPHLTSYVSGNHFMSPADYATIYDINPLYSASITGSTQTIAIVGQSTVSTTDLNNFRSAAGLPASTVTMTLVGAKAAQCAGDEGESDLDLEWSGGVAKSAKIVFLYAGVGTGGSCTSRSYNVWDALHYAVQNKIAPFISTSYGYCEAGLGLTQTNTYRGWAQQAVTQGQTIVAASGDEGAADCEPSTSTSATTGLAVDVPASIPEVTGAGGNEFTGDAAATVSGTAPNTTAAATSYWAASGTGSDVVSTALSYIPEEAWNDTAASLAANPPGGFSASGGGASIYYTKGSTQAFWQTGTGVPADGQRDVPDISIDASPDHDGYLVCSEDDGTGNVVVTCTSGFRDGSGGNFAVVGGTSAAAPTFSASLALVNEYLGNVPPTGLTAGVAPLNQTLYQLPGNSPEPFHDVTSGNNIVPCTTGTPNCTNGSLGFSAGVGYDQVTGLGSIDVYNFAQIMARTPTTVTVSPSSSSVNLGANVTLTATVAPSGATGTVNFYDNGSTTSLGPGTISGGTATLTTSSLTIGSNSITAQYSGDTSYRLSNSATPASVSVASSFTLNSTSTGTLSVAQGQTAGPVNITVTSTQGFVESSGSTTQTVLPVSYSCLGLPSEAVCIFSPLSPTQATGISLTITTTAPTSRLEQPFERKSGIMYALLMPGVLGIVCMAGSRRRITTSLRVLGLIVVLGFSTMWMASCGGTSGSSNKNPGTPVGSSTIVVNATTGGSSPITSSMSFTLSVTP